MKHSRHRLHVRRLWLHARRLALQLSLLLLPLQMLWIADTAAAPAATSTSGSASDSAAILATAQAQLVADFPACLAQLQQDAQAAGISPAVARGVLAQLQPDPQILVYDRRQPEFTQTFGDYFNRRVSPDRIRRGRELLASHHDLLRRVQQATGVPPHYLVAFWGLETNFGSYFGKLHIPRSLATLACDPRRSTFFTRELLAALQIIDAGDIGADDMLGSWAGAMGHVQFMPSVFLRHARDGDGDGRRDLWGSVPDAMASAGAFLADLGWQPGVRWGREVLLPAGFDYQLANAADARPLSAWADLGITDVRGRPLPALDLPSRLRVPAGHRGPAFVTYANFDVIMGWNRSVSYALAVGHLADRIAGAGGLQQQPPEDDLRLSKDQVSAMQQALLAAGFDPDGVDGLIGPATRAALSRWQARAGLVADGHPSAATIARLVPGLL